MPTSIPRCQGRVYPSSARPNETWQCCGAPLRLPTAGRPTAAVLADLAKISLIHTGRRHVHGTGRAGEIIITRDSGARLAGGLVSIRPGRTRPVLLQASAVSENSER